VQQVLQQVPAAAAVQLAAMHGHLLTPTSQMASSSMSPPAAGTTMQLLMPQGATAGRCVGCGRPQQLQQQQQQQQGQGQEVSWHLPTAGLAGLTQGVHDQSAASLGGTLLAGAVQAGTSTSPAAAAAAAPAAPPTPGSGIMLPPAPRHAAARASAAPHSLLRPTLTTWASWHCRAKCCSSCVASLQRKSCRLCIW
jgi:hypothetical protein